jgi:hypothetical protein
VQQRGRRWWNYVQTKKALITLNECPQSVTDIITLQVPLARAPLCHRKAAPRVLFCVQHGNRWRRCCRTLREADLFVTAQPVRAAQDVETVYGRRRPRGRATARASRKHSRLSSEDGKQ